MKETSLTIEEETQILRVYENAEDIGRKKNS